MRYGGKCYCMKYVEGWLLCFVDVMFWYKFFYVCLLVGVYDVIFIIMSKLGSFVGEFYRFLRIL